MSRTRKGSKGPGYEVDRKREGKRGYRSAGAVAKRVGKRAQRRIGKTAASEIDVTPIVDAFANLAIAMWLDGVEIDPPKRKPPRRRASLTSKP